MSEYQVIINFKAPRLVPELGQADHRITLSGEVDNILSAVKFAISQVMDPDSDITALTIAAHRLTDGLATPDIEEEAIRHVDSLFGDNIAERVDSG